MQGRVLTRLADKQSKFAQAELPKELAADAQVSCVHRLGASCDAIALSLQDIAGYAIVGLQHIEEARGRGAGGGIGDGGAVRHHAGAGGAWR